MARRRLTPLPAAADVPRAEHLPDPARNPAPGPFAAVVRPPAAPPAAIAAPIARVAAEAAGAAALEEMAEALRRARDEGRLALDLPLETIAPDHLTRDRLPA